MNSDPEQLHKEASPEAEGEYEEYGEEEPQYDGEKLLDSKAARKRADEDAKLLANRIALLKMEEQKAWKKIEETKKKAKQIVDQRKRNQELTKKREERRMKKALEERKLQEKNHMMKQQLREGIDEGRQRHF